MKPPILPLLFAVLLFIAMMISLEIGRWLASGATRDLRVRVSSSGPRNP